MPRPSAELEALEEAYASASREVIQLVELRQTRSDEMMTSTTHLTPDGRAELELLDERVTAAFQASAKAGAALDAAIGDAAYWMEGPDEPRWFRARDLHETLSYRGPRSRAAFALACAERLAPAYMAYAASSRRDDSEALTVILDGAWEHLAADGSSPVDLAPALALRATIAATQDNEWHPYADYAVAACEHALRALVSGDPLEAVYAAQCAYSAMLRHVNERLGIDDKDAAREPLVQAEVSRQFRDLCESLLEIEADAVRSIRALAKAEGAELFRSSRG